MKSAKPLIEKKLIYPNETLTLMINVVLSVILLHYHELVTLATWYTFALSEIQHNQTCISDQVNIKGK